MNPAATDIDTADQPNRPSLLLVDQLGLLVQLQKLADENAVLQLSGPARDAVIKLVIDELASQLSLVVIDHCGRFAPDLSTSSQARRWNIITAGLSLAAINLLPGPTYESAEWASNATAFLLTLIEHPAGDESPEWQLLNQLLLRAPTRDGKSKQPAKKNTNNALGDIESAITIMATNQAIKIGALSDEQIIEPAARKKLALNLNRLLLGDSLSCWTDGTKLSEALATHPKKSHYLPLNHLSSPIKNWAAAKLQNELAKAFTQPSNHHTAIVIADLPINDSSLATCHELQLDRDRENPSSSDVAKTQELFCDLIEIPNGNSLVRLTSKLPTQQLELLAIPPRSPAVGQLTIDGLQRLIENNPVEKTEPAALADLLPIAYLPAAVQPPETLHYLPCILIDVELSYQILSLRFRHSSRITALVMLTPSGGSIDDRSLVASPQEWPQDLLSAPEQEAAAVSTPIMLASQRGIERARRKVTKALTNQELLIVYHCRELGITSEPGTSSEDFEDQLRKHSNERHEARLAAIKARYEPRLLHVIHRVRKTDSKVKKQQRKVNGGSILLRPARYVATKAITSQLNPASHLPQRRKAKENRPQRELIELEKRLERLRRQHRELQQQYEQDREKQLKLHKAEELEYRRFDIKPLKGGVKLLKMRLCGCPWGILNDQESPLYSL